MKVLFLIDSLPKGGKERRMIALIKGLKKKYRVKIALVIFRNKIEYQEIYDLDIDFRIIERKPKYNPNTFGKLYRICRKIQPDVIHAWSNMSVFFAIPISRLLGIKLLNGCVANAPYNLRFWQKDSFLTKFTFLFSDFIVGNSNAGLISYGAPNKKSLSIPNGFDFNRVGDIENPKSIKERYNISSSFVVGKVAAFADRKDYKTYIQAAQDICQLRDDVVFFAIGDGPNLESIKKTVPTSLRDRIVFTGLVSDVESLINIFNIGVLSTNNEVHGEGISNSIMEYMALGKPVIATDSGGTNEIVSNGETGFLVPPKSPEVLANRISLLLDNTSKAKEMGQAGKKRISEYFNLDKMTDVYFELYKKLLYSGN